MLGRGARGYVQGFPPKNHEGRSLVRLINSPITMAGTPLGEFLKPAILILIAILTLSEQDYNKALAKCLGGKVEVQYKYKKGKIRIDIETKTHAIEAGLDRRSSLDSIHQVLFAANLSGKQPMIIIYDTNQKEGVMEYQLRILSNQLGIAYHSISAKALSEGECFFLTQ